MFCFLLAAVLVVCACTSPVLESMGSILQQAEPAMAPDLAFTENAREVTVSCFELLFTAAHLY